MPDDRERTGAPGDRTVPILSVEDHGRDYVIGGPLGILLGLLGVRRKRKWT